MMNMLFPRGAKAIDPQPALVPTTSSVGGTNWRLVQAAEVMRQSIRRGNAGSGPGPSRFNQVPQVSVPQSF